MSKRWLAARHMYTAKAAMFAVTSLRRPIKCPFLVPHANTQTRKDQIYIYLRIPYQGNHVQLGVIGLREHGFLGNGIYVRIYRTYVAYIDVFVIETS